MDVLWRRTWEIKSQESKVKSHCLGFVAVVVVRDILAFQGATFHAPDARFTAGMEDSDHISPSPADAIFTLGTQPYDS